MPVLVVLFASLFLAAAVRPAFASPLEAERWRNRVVVVFGDGEDAAFRRQADLLLADEDALRERDMLVIGVEGGQARVLWGEARSAPDAASLRDSFGVAADTPFAAVLVGKDGGEKRRVFEPAPAASFFELIDSMPMRQSEMRAK